MSLFPRYLMTVGILTAIAVALRIGFGISSAVTLGVLLIGWPLLGTLITIDDDLPGGWSNPNGKVVPEWKRLWWWADLFLVRGALVAAAFVVENAIEGHLSFPVVVVAILMIGLGLPLFVRGVRREAGDTV